MEPKPEPLRHALEQDTQPSQYLSPPRSENGTDRLQEQPDKNKGQPAIDQNPTQRESGNTPGHPMPQRPKVSTSTDEPPGSSISRRGGTEFPALQPVK